MWTNMNQSYTTEDAIKYRAVRDKIIESVPEIMEGAEITRVNSQVMECNADMPIERPITLADVLIAMEKTTKELTDKDLHNLSLFPWEMWDCHKNSLEQQSAETITFLFEILCQ